MIKSEIEEQVKAKVVIVWHAIQKVGFWVLLIAAVGFYFGNKYSEKQIDRRVSDSIKLGNFLYAVTDTKGVAVTKAFDVKERIMP